MILSVSMPVYNAREYLDDGIRSVMGQTYTDFELILVNDGSKDDSLEICERWREKYPDRIRVVDKKNEGSLLTRKRCIDESRGEYLYICDADDSLTDERAFEKIVGEIRKTGADVYFFDHTTDNGTRTSYPFGDREMFSGEARAKVYDVFLHDTRLYPLWNKVFRKSLTDPAEDYQDIEGIVYGTDLFQSIPVMARAESFVYLKEAFYNYRFSGNGQSIVHKFKPQSYTTARKNQTRLEKYAHDYHWNVEDLDGKLLRIRMIRISTAIYKVRLMDKKDRAGRYRYLKEIGEDGFFRKSFSIKSVPAKRALLLLAMYLRLYRILAVIL